MQSDTYKAMVGLPPKIGAGACTAIGALANILPEDRLSQIVGPYLSVSNIRVAGVALLIIAAVYFAALWLLKPSKSDEKEGRQQSLQNNGALVQGNGSFQNTGTMNFIYGAKDASPQGNTFVGDYDEKLAAGSGNTVVSHLDALRPGNALGSGSHHHPESASIGAGAGIGSGVTADEGVSALTNDQLRQRTRSLIDRLRELQRNVRTEHRRIIFSKDGDGRHKKLDDLSEKLLTSFNAHYKGECRILRSAIKDRLGIFSDDITVRERALDFGHLSGPQPIEEIATYFEDLLAKLPA